MRIPGLPPELERYNRIYPENGSETLPPDVIAAIAEWAGLPGVTFMQVTKGESSGRPGAIGNDPGGTTGIGLWQITTGYNDETIAKYGGEAAMRNPILNALAAKVIYDSQGLGAWYGDQHVTDENAHYTGRIPTSGGGASAAGTGEAVAASGGLFGEAERSGALKALLWVTFVFSGAGLTFAGLARMMGLRGTEIVGGVAKTAAMATPAGRAAGAAGAVK